MRAGAPDADPSLSPLTRCRKAIDAVRRPCDTAGMTDAEFRAWLADTRADIAARLAEVDALDLAALDPITRADMDALRAELIELQAATEDEAIAREFAASEMVDRELTADEARALLRRQ